jgi:integral membrane protein
MSSLSIFRKVAVAEGISYLLLLFVAMPLKYWADLPLYVKYTGWAHGLLFVLYAATLVMAWQEQKWKFGKAVLIFLASLLPFAPFIVDRRLKDERPQTLNNSL